METVRPQHGGTDDAQLMVLVGRGDTDAFETLVRRHQQALLNFFCRMGVDSDAEDLVQETFVKVFNYRNRYRPSAKFTTFLYTVARNVHVDAFRKSARKQELMEEEKAEAETAQSHDGGISRLRLRMDLRELLNGLPERLRDVVVLGVQQGLKYEEIASIMDVPLGTVKSRMFTALERLREMFDEDARRRE